jgi:hypothetical protein
VQQKLIPFFEKETKKGETVVVYAERVGANKFWRRMGLGFFR